MDNGKWIMDNNILRQAQDDLFNRNLTYESEVANG